MHYTTVNTFPKSLTAFLKQVRVDSTKWPTALQNLHEQLAHVGGMHLLNLWCLNRNQEVFFET